MSCVYVTCRQWAKTAPEKEERHLSVQHQWADLCGCVIEQMSGTSPHPSLCDGTDALGVHWHCQACSDSLTPQSANSHLSDASKQGKGLRRKQSRPLIFLPSASPFHPPLHPKGNTIVRGLKKGAGSRQSRADPQTTQKGDNSCI